MISVQEIQDSIQEEMTVFEEKFKDALKSDIALLNRIMHFVVKRKGKQIRPMFIFLVAKLLNKNAVKESTYTAASLIELLHTATLVHDDVVDDANERRGFFSVNALWKNKVAVLVGDYLLSRGLLVSVENNEYRQLQIISATMKEMIEGELLQAEKARKLDITEEVYFEIIHHKTASLIAACCMSGAASVTENEDTILKMKKFGELVGLAFQIKDDIFDYGDSDKIGKPTGNDIRERKMTLPLIYALKNSPENVKRELINIVKNHNEEPSKIKIAIKHVVNAGGVKYAHDRMVQIKDEALKLLEEFPDNEAKNALKGLVEYTVYRDK
jgi:octaprenyl-diphosphate synthase